MHAHATLSILHDEHSVLSAMLRTIGLLLGESRRRGTLPDFTMLRAMLFCVDEFPERLHHTKESQLLFPRIRERSGSEFAAVLGGLDDDHSRSEQSVRELLADACNEGERQHELGASARRAPPHPQVVAAGRVSRLGIASVAQERPHEVQGRHHARDAIVVNHDDVMDLAFDHQSCHFADRRVRADDDWLVAAPLPRPHCG